MNTETTETKDAAPDVLSTCSFCGKRKSYDGWIACAVCKEKGDVEHAAKMARFDALSKEMSAALEDIPGETEQAGDRRFDAQLEELLTAARQRVHDLEEMKDDIAHLAYEDEKADMKARGLWVPGPFDPPSVGRNLDPETLAKWAGWWRCESSSTITTEKASAEG